jgi:hypothetical protein
MASEDGLCLFTGGHGWSWLFSPPASPRLCSVQGHISVTSVLCRCVDAACFLVWLSCVHSLFYNTVTWALDYFFWLAPPSFYLQVRNTGFFEVLLKPRHV